MPHNKALIRDFTQGAVTKRSLISFAIFHETGYTIPMDEDIIFKPTAFKHGIAEADIRHAFERPLFDHVMPDEEGKNLLIGLDRSGNPLEILYNVLDEDTINVFHAMRCRKVYRELINL
jgi:hypothetical protein